MSATAVTSTVDHLVIAAASLEQGVAWCVETLGVDPGPGGRHRLMATHNRLLKIGAPRWPQAYLEIIAADPAADAPPADGRRRWFGLDDPALRRELEIAPRLVHFVAATSDLGAATARLAALGEDVGESVGASRATPHGELRWRITVRDDGLPRHRGALPTLIAWDSRHPTASMTDSGIRLTALRVRSERADRLRRAWAAIGLEAVELLAGDPAEPVLEAVLETPRGSVTLAGGVPPAG